MTIQSGAGAKWWFRGLPFKTVVPAKLLGTERYWLDGQPLSPYASGRTDLVPPLFTDTDTFYAPTVLSIGALNPSLVVDVDVFYSPTSVSSGLLTPSLYVDTDIFFLHSLTSRYTMTASLVVDTDTFYGPTITQVSGLSPSLVTDVDVFYAPTVTQDQALAPSLYADTDTFYSPTVAIDQVLVPSLYADTDTFYQPVVTTTYSLQPSLYSDTDVFYVPTVNTSVTVTAPLVVDADVIYPAAISSTIYLYPPFVVDECVIHTPTDMSLYFVFAGLHVDSDIFYSPTLTPGPVSILPPLYVDPDIFYTPAVQRLKAHGNPPGHDPGTVTTDLKYSTSLVMDESGLIIALQMSTTSTKTVNTRMMIYADSAGVPGALLAQSAVKTSVVSGLNTYTLLVPLSVLVGQTIWVALHTDANVNWLLSSSPGGSRYNTDLFSDGPSDPFGASSLDNKKAPVLIILLEAVNASILPPLYVDSDSFFSPSISATYSLLPPFIGDTDFFYGPVVVSGSLLSPELYVDADAFYAPTVTPGAVTLLPSHVTDDEEVIIPIVGVQSQPVQLFPPHILSDDVIHQSTVTSEGADLPPTLVVDDDTFYPPSIVSVYTVSPSLVPADDAIYSDTVSPGPVTLHPPHVVDVDQHWISVLARGVGTDYLLPSLFVDADIIYASLIGRPRRAHEVSITGNASRPTMTALVDNGATIDGDSRGTNTDLRGRADWDATIEGDRSHTDIDIEGNDA